MIYLSAAFLSPFVGGGFLKSGKYKKRLIPLFEPAYRLDTTVVFVSD